MNFDNLLMRTSNYQALKVQNMLIRTMAIDRVTQLGCKGGARDGH